MSQGVIATPDPVWGKQSLAQTWFSCLWYLRPDVLRH
jgi:hypothetical protein